MAAVVVKVGGAVAGEPAHAVAHLVRALRLSGWQPVVVHGGGGEISQWQERLGLPVQFRGGRRVTDAATLELVEMVLTGRVGRSWVAALQAAGLEAVALSGRDGSLLVAEKFAPGGEDLGWVGQVVAVDTRPVEVLLEAGYVPVVSPVARSSDPLQPLNVNADEAAAALAAALKAPLLLLLTDVPGFLADPADPSTPVPRLTASQARAQLDQGVASAGMRPKLEAALAALAGGVARVQILSGQDAQALQALADALVPGLDVRQARLPGTAVVPDEEEPVVSPTAPAVQAAPAAGLALAPAAREEPGPAGTLWIQRGSRVLMNNYGRLSLVVAHGWGALLYDADGRAWLDFVSGLAVTSLGHAHPRLARRIAHQASRLLHVSNLYWIPEQIQLAEQLCTLSGMERWFFCNSGAEANEAAIKLARRFGLTRKGPQCYEIIACTGGFHGRTLGALTATGQERYRQGFGPLVPGFRHVPFGDLEAVEAALDDRVCAVLVEPIQGERGVVVPPEGYLRGLRRLCDRHGILLILDEVQTGIGRTGRWFAFQHEDAVPDVITLAKALAGGVPIGAVGARGAAASVLGPGDHASTFGGNPLACAAALETLAVMEQEGLVERAARLGARLMEILRRGLEGNPLAVEVRGKGLMVGVVLQRGAPEVARLCRARGLLVNPIGEQVIRLLPPLTLTEAELEHGCRILLSALAEVAEAQAGPAEPAPAGSLPQGKEVRS